ncbi:MAG: hypothetical protein ACREJ2_02580 [Planctomycetota bacterium]
MKRRRGGAVWPLGAAGAAGAVGAAGIALAFASCGALAAAEAPGPTPAPAPLPAPQPQPQPQKAPPANPPAIVLPVGAGEAVTLPGAPRLWRQIAGPAVVATEVAGDSTWRLFEPGIYRFAVAAGATPVSSIHDGAWQVFPGKTQLLGDRRPEVALLASVDAQAGRPIVIASLNPNDADGDGLTWYFRVLPNAIFAPGSATAPPGGGTPAAAPAGGAPTDAPPVAPVATASSLTDPAIDTAEEPAGRTALPGVWLYTRGDAPECVFQADRAGTYTVECSVFDGQIFSHPARQQISVGGTPPSATAGAQPIDVLAAGLAMRDLMQTCSGRTQIPIVFQAGAGWQRRRLDLRVRGLPFMRVLDLVAWQTGANYRVENLPGGGGGDREAIIWLNGWSALRAEGMAADDLNVSDFAQTPDGRDIGPPLEDTVREALAARSDARCNLHGRSANLCAAVYLPVSARRRLLQVLQALNAPLEPQASPTAAADRRACELELQLNDVTCDFVDRPLGDVLVDLGRQLHLALVVNPPELFPAAEAASADPIAVAQGVGGFSAAQSGPTPGNSALDRIHVSLAVHHESGRVAIDRLVAALDAIRRRANPGAAKLHAQFWTERSLVIAIDPPLTEPRDGAPGSGQWLWQSAVVRAYDLTDVLNATGGTGEAVEQRVRSAFAREFHDPAASLSWWPRKKALLVIQRPAVQDAVSSLLVDLEAAARSPLHQPAAPTEAPATAEANGASGAKETGGAGAANGASDADGRAGAAGQIGTP